MKKTLSVILVLAIMFAFVGCGSNSKKDSANSADEKKTKTVEDVAGRKVEVPTKVDKIICLGSGAPRMAAYLDVMDKMVGSEEIDTKEKTVLRDYNSIYYDKLKSLPTVGKGGGSGQNNSFPEEIIKAAPDVIVGSYTAEAADELQKQTNIPVVSVQYSSSNAFDKNEGYYKSMKVFAEVVDKQDRCEKLLAYTDKCIEDLDNRTKNIPDSDKKKAYTGAVTYNGKHGFAGTYAKFPPFVQVNGKNVADEAKKEGGYFEVDLEKVLAWDPDYIFLDPGSLNLVKEDYKNNTEFFKSLRAVKEGNVYTMPSFNHAATNITYALMDAYHAGKILFPDQFADVDLPKKSGEILNEFLGKDIFEDMEKGGLYYGKLDITK